MPVSLPNTLTAGTVEDINDVQANFEALRDYINGDITNAEIDAAAAIAYSKLSLAGSLTKDDLATVLADVLGVSSTATVRRGKSIIATEEAVTSTSYATLTTPDQVASVVLPTDGLLTIGYQALWKSSVSAAGRAAIFLGADQLKIVDSAAPVVQEVASTGTGYTTIATAGKGLTVNGQGTSQVTTGQVLAADSSAGGGLCCILVAAGTYTVSIKFKSASGSVTAKERKLWVKAEGY